jgi:NTE family protein
MSKNISLVLSGGGARGIAHIGVINVLQEHGFHINAVAGTSMGAMVSGVFASGTLPEFKKWLEDADLKEAMKILDFSFSNPGFIKGEKLMKKMQDFLPYKNIENLKIPYTAIATDILKREEVVLDKGSVSDAIRASIAIPSVFTPLEKQDKVLVDGGLVNNIPINHVSKKKDDLVIAVCVNSDIPMPEEYNKIMQFKENKEENEYIEKLKKIRLYIRKFIDRKKEKEDSEKIGQYELIDRSIHMLITEKSKVIIANYPPDILINIPREMCGTFDFLKAKKIIDIGRLATLEQLQSQNLI